MIKLGKVTLELWRSDISQSWHCRIQRRASRFYYDVLGEGEGDREVALREAVAEAREFIRARRAKVMAVAS